MVARQSWSRRDALGAMAGGLPSTLLFPPKVAEAADKMTKARAEYQDKPNGIYSCATCTLFEKPNRCKVVEGEVSPDGWCTAFAMAD